MNADQEKEKSTLIRTDDIDLKRELKEKVNRSILSANIRANPW
jgi:hypothetical protein